MLLLWFQRHGQGREILSCETEFEGRWKENRKHGPGIKKLKTGRMEEQVTPLCYACTKMASKLTYLVNNSVKAGCVWVEFKFICSKENLTTWTCIGWSHVYSQVHASCQTIKAGFFMLQAGSCMRCHSVLEVNNNGLVLAIGWPDDEKLASTCVEIWFTWLYMWTQVIASRHKLETCICLWLRLGRAFKKIYTFIDDSMSRVQFKNFQV